MKKHFLSVISIFLCVCIAVGCAPIFSFTAEAAATANGGTLSALTATSLNSVFGSGNWTVTGTTVNIEKDLQLANTVEVAIDMGINIAAGKTIYGPNNESAFSVHDKHTLSFTGTGCVKGADGSNGRELISGYPLDGSSAHSAVYASPDSTVIVDGITLKGGNGGNGYEYTGNVQNDTTSTLHGGDGGDGAHAVDGGTLKLISGSLIGGNGGKAGNASEHSNNTIIFGAKGGCGGNAGSGASCYSVSVEGGTCQGGNGGNGGWSCDNKFLLNEVYSYSAGGNGGCGIIGSVEYITGGTFTGGNGGNAGSCSMNKGADGGNGGAGLSCEAATSIIGGSFSGGIHGNGGYGTLNNKTANGKDGEYGCGIKSYGELNLFSDVTVTGECGICCFNNVRSAAAVTATASSAFVIFNSYNSSGNTQYSVSNTGVVSAEDLTVRFTNHSQDYTGNDAGTLYVYNDDTAAYSVNSNAAINKATTKPSLSVSAETVDFGSYNIPYSTEKQTVSVGLKSKALAPVKITASQNANYSISNTSADYYLSRGYLMAQDSRLDFEISPKTTLSYGSYNTALSFSGEDVKNGTCNLKFTVTNQKSTQVNVTQSRVKLPNGSKTASFTLSTDMANGDVFRIYDAASTICGTTEAFGKTLRVTLDNAPSAPTKYYITRQSTGLLESNKTAVTIGYPIKLTVTNQPENLVYISGAIKGSQKQLTAAAVTDVGDTPSYQWYSCGSDKSNPVAYSAEQNVYPDFSLGEGTYYFYCRISADDGEYVDTSAVSVTITAAPLDTETVDGEYYYLIHNAAELAAFRDMVNGSAAAAAVPYANARLENDISLNSMAVLENGELAPDTSALSAWTPIASYSGVFDGGEHAISSMYINTENDGALFGNIESSGCIKDLKVSGSYVKTSNMSASVFCVKNYGKLTDCISENNLVIARAFVSGICVSNYGTITGCTNSSTVTATSMFASGIAANNDGEILNSVNSGKITSADNYAAGITESNYGKISDCGNLGEISGKDYVGGIAGQFFDGQYIAACFNYGAVKATGGRVGAICGFTKKDVYGCCYLNGTARSAVGAAEGSPKTDDNIALSEAQFASGYASLCLNMRSAQALTKVNSYNSAVWSVGEKYPVLANDSNKAVYAVRYTDENGTVIESRGVKEGDKIDYGVNYLPADGTKVFAGWTGSSTVMAQQEVVLTAAVAAAPTELEKEYDVADSKTYFLIDSYEDLCTFRSYVNGTAPYSQPHTYANAKLTGDITINANVLDENNNINSGTFTAFGAPIGNYNSNTALTYNGVFNGQGHTISGLYFDKCTNYTGLFGACGEYAVIRNLSVVDSAVNGNGAGASVGIIAGYSTGTISGCFVNGYVNAWGYVGGIAGRSLGIMENCGADIKLTASYNGVGGLACVTNGVMKNCFVTGELICDGTAVHPVAPMFQTGNINDVSDVYYLDTMKKNGNGGEAVSTAQLASGMVAWLLNTNGGSKANSAVWSQGDKYPVLADASNPAVYRAAFSSNGSETVYYLESGCAIPDTSPAQKDGYTVAWDKAVPQSIGNADININAVYTPISYEAVFVAGGVEVARLNYTVETEALTEPVIPEKPCFSADWETYAFTVGGITVNAVYTPLEHNYVPDVTPPVCTEKGYTTYTCSVCGDTYIANETNALSHSFTSYVYNNDATCTADGTETAKCDRCDVTDMRTKAQTALSHSFTSYVYNNDATCTADGTETAKCDRCDVTDTRTKAQTARGHIDANSNLLCDRCGKAMISGITVSGIKAASNKSTCVKLTWTALKGATGYRVYKYDAAKKKYVNYKTVTTNSFTDTGLNENSNVYYRIRPFVTVAGKNYYGKTSGTFKTYTSPAKVKGLKTSAYSTTKLTLTWTKTEGADGYILYKYNPTAKKYEAVKTVAADKNTATIKGLKTGTKYYFRVKAFRTIKGKKYYSDTSNTFKTATRPVDTVILSAKSSAKGSLTVKYGTVKSATGYLVQYSTSKSFKSGVISKLSGKNSFTATGLKSGKTYYVRVRPYVLAGKTRVYSPAVSIIRSVKVK